MGEKNKVVEGVQQAREPPWPARRLTSYRTTWILEWRVALRRMVLSYR